MGEGPATEVLAGQPSDYSTTSVLPPVTPRRGRVPVLIIGAAAIAVVAVAAGAAAVVMGVFGGDAGQPEELLPASTVAFAKIDLDPPVAQKVNAVRFLRKLPGVADGLTEDGDLREWAYTKLSEGDAKAPAWSEVKAWIGDRAAVAAVPATDATKNADAVLLLQVTDEGKARASLVKSESSRKSGVVVKGGWAYIAESQQIVDGVVTRAEKASLAEAVTYKADAARMGEDGIATMWIDAKAAQALAAKAPGTAAKQLAGAQGMLDAVTGHGTVALRFEGSQLQLVGEFSGASSGGVTAKGTGIEALPADSLAAVGVAGAGPAIKAQWPQLLKSLSSTGTDIASMVPMLEQQTGLKFPDDLAALLGDKITASLGAPDASGMPAVGARAVTSGSGAGRALDTLLSLVGDRVPLQRKDLSDGWVLATTSDAAAALAKDGGLGAAEKFRSVLPDSADATLAVYVDLAGVAQSYQQFGLDAKTVEVLKALGPLGVMSTSTGAESGRMTIRVGSR
jgi:hypothetical protein